MITYTTKKFFIAICVSLFLMGSLAMAEKPKVDSLRSEKIPEWTFAIYIEGGEPDMHYWLIKNINDMALAKADKKKIHIVIQVHFEKDEAWRYVIDNNAIKPVENVSFGLDYEQNIVDFMQWTVNQHPAKHYGLILSNCGFGILDPTYQPTASPGSFHWDVEADEPGHECVGGVCPLKGLELRGLMFNDKAQRFLNNAAMISTFKTIKETVLKDKKLDIVGTDCCKMAMLEVGYQMKDFVHYLIGSENCELLNGWNFKDFFSYFKDEKPLDTLAVVNAIIKTYKDFYEKNTIQNTYTLAALDLSEIDPLVENINSVVTLIKKLMVQNPEIFKSILLNARTKSPSMCEASYYLDFGSIYEKLLEELNNTSITMLDTESVDTLKNLLTRGLDLIKPIIVAKALGSVVDHFSGMSIYFPRNHIDVSYFYTPFAQETSWLSFLQTFIATLANDIGYCYDAEITTT